MDTSAGMWFTEEFLPCYTEAYANLAENKLPGANEQVILQDARKLLAYSAALKMGWKLPSAAT